MQAVCQCCGMWLHQPDSLQWILTTQLIAGLLTLICDVLICRLSKLKNDIRRQEGDAGGTFEAMEVEHLP